MTQQTGKMYSLYCFKSNTNDAHEWMSLKVDEEEEEEEEEGDNDGMRNMSENCAMMAKMDCFKSNTNDAHERMDACEG